MGILTHIDFQDAVNTVANEMGVEIILKSKTNKKLSKGIVNYFWHSLLAGIMVNELGGIENLINKKQKSDLLDLKK